MFGGERCHNLRHTETSCWYTSPHSTWYQTPTTAGPDGNVAADLGGGGAHLGSEDSSRDCALANGEVRERLRASAGDVEVARELRGGAAQETR